MMLGGVDTTKLTADLKRLADANERIATALESLLELSRKELEGGNT